jgi:hypothetical protein
MLEGMLAISAWQWTVAAALFLGIGLVGWTMLRAIGRGGGAERIEPEEVAGLDVHLVCVECGTEFQVTKLGEIQIPRHCGERMSVVRRTRQRAENN